MAAVTIHSDFEVQENKNLLLLPLFPLLFAWSDGTRAMILVFWMLSFKPAFSLSSFILIRRFFSSSSLSSIKVVSSVYLRLLIFLLAILSPACDSSSLAFHMMPSECKLNKKGESIQPCRILFSILNQSVVLYPVLTIASWSAYVYQEKSKVVLQSYLLRIFQFVLIHTVKGFSIVNEVEVDVVWNSLAFSMIQWMLAIWSLVPLPFLNPVCTSVSSQFTFCWSLARRILSITFLACKKSTIVQ